MLTILQQHEKLVKTRPRLFLWPTASHRCFVFPPLNTAYARRHPYYLEVRSYFIHSLQQLPFIFRIRGKQSRRRT